MCVCVCVCVCVRVDHPVNHSNELLTEFTHAGVRHKIDAMAVLWSLNFRPKLAAPEVPAHSQVHVVKF